MLKYIIDVTAFVEILPHNGSKSNGRIKALQDSINFAKIKMTICLLK
jgi:hypothetical protein